MEMLNRRAEKGKSHSNANGGSNHNAVPLASRVGDDGGTPRPTPLSSVAIATSLTNVTGFSLLVSPL